MEAELKEMIAKKDHMEQEISKLNNQIVILEETKNMGKSVVDHEGFPRSDLDFGELANYRNLKRRRAQLNNDHLALMKIIESKLYQLHATYGSNNKQTTSETREPKTNPMMMVKKQQKIHIQPEAKQTYKIDYLTPFAVISLVVPNSPAERDGLKVRDLVSQFSSVNVYSLDWQKQIVSLVKEGQPIKVVIMRLVNQQGTFNQHPIFQLKDKNKYHKIVLELTPGKFEGKGLLGCKIDSL